ncbi:MAG: GNAT family N-acetyltransferase [Deltaproteobacteria bacterium]|nr:GNAT family N-acetyltransferase [Deltaproteobacteria bacterium]
MPCADKNWAEHCENVTTAEAAVAAIRPGGRVFVGTGCAQPQVLVRAMTARGPQLPDTEIMHLITEGPAPYTTAEATRYFNVNAFFIGENIRALIAEGRASYTPVMLSDIPDLFDSGRIPIDVALVMVSPPDDRGMCSLGVSVDIVRAAMRNARLVIAEVNPRMPRTRGDSLVSVFDMDYLVPVDYPLAEFHLPQESETHRQIGEYVAALVEDGSTLEVGIGRIPHSVVPYLKCKKNLGIHTEMLSDSIIDLIEAGVVNGAEKTTDHGRVVVSFAMGTQRLFDYVNDNPIFAFHPAEYVNDSALIAKQRKMVAINMALQVDLTGQVCADSIGTEFYSGIGGQVDFNRGAAKCPDGKAIIALPSTARQGTVSRITTFLTEGAGVVTSRGDVHYVVTEFGVAYLHGKTVAERALALITIAHPDFRSELLMGAVRARYVKPAMGGFQDRLQLGPSDLRTTMLLNDGTQVQFRHVHPTDEAGMAELFNALSRETLYYRFMSRTPRIPRKQIMDFTYVDHRSEVALVGYLPAAHGDEIIAIGRYYLDKTTNRAEVAFVVRDDWQRNGIGKFLYRQLARIARGNGISGFTAEVLADNKGMQTVFHGSGHKLKMKRADGVCHFDIEL